MVPGHLCVGCQTLLTRFGVDLWRHLTDVPPVRQNDSAFASARPATARGFRQCSGPRVRSLPAPGSWTDREPLNPPW